MTEPEKPGEPEGHDLADIEQVSAIGIIYFNLLSQSLYPSNSLFHVVFSYVYTLALYHGCINTQN